MYKIIGDLKQKGEPTPYNSVEIENENYLVEEKDNKIIKKIPLGKIDLGEIELAKAIEETNSEYDWDTNYYDLKGENWHIILDLIKKQEKVIDEMAEKYATCKTCLDYTCKKRDKQGQAKECIKQYFYRKVERG